MTQLIFFYKTTTAYFSYNYQKGFGWYNDLYSEKLESEMGMDISPQYFIDREALERIKNQMPTAKVIISVRDPVDWIKSNFHQIAILLFIYDDDV